MILKQISYVLFLISLTNVLVGQIDVNSIPPNYTLCPSEIIGTGNCPFTYLGNTIQMDLSSVSASNNTIRIRFRKCDLTNFNGGGTLYVKLGDDVCGNIIGQTTVVNDDDVQSVFIPYDFWDIGSIFITGVLVSGNQTRYWAGTLELYKDCEDYEVSNVQISDTEVYQGQEDVEFSCLLKNLGADDGADDVNFFISTNTTISASDHDLGDENFTLAPFSQTSISRIRDIPVLSAGGYFVIAKADENDSDEECQEFNNTSFTYFTLVEAADLTATAIDFSPSELCPSQDLEVSITFKNDGDATVGNFTYNVYFSKNASLSTSSDELLSSNTYGGLLFPNQNDTKNIIIDIPSGFNDDDYYIIIDIDPDNVVDEQSNNNNVFISSSTIAVKEPPTIVIPKDNELASSLTPVLDWVSTGPGHTYALVIQEFPSLTIVHTANNIQGSAYAVPSNVLEYDNSYQWIVASDVTSPSCNSGLELFRTPSAPCNDDQYEPNNSVAQRNTTVYDNLMEGSQGLVLGMISNTSDEDYFSIQLPSSGEIVISLDVPSNKDFDMFLYDFESNALLASSTFVGDVTESISFTNTTGTRELYLRLIGKNGSFSCASYRLMTSWAIEAAQLTVTSPNGGEFFNSNDIINIFYSHGNSSNNITIELEDNVGGIIDFIAVNIPSAGSFIYDNQGCLSTGDYKIKIYEHLNTNVIDRSDAFFRITNPDECPCVITNPSNTSDPELVTAVHELCSREIINDGDTRPDDFITRAELAKIVFIALLDNTDAQPSDYFPSPFLDLQNKLDWFYRYVKALTYLDYSDGVSPFGRHFAHFRPEEHINRQHVVKVILEAFDITEDCLIPNVFDDVPISTDGYCYIVSAADLGIVKSTIPFRPTISTTREEVFLMIYRLLLLIEDNSITKPSPELNDYYCPGNFSVANLSRGIGIGEGNFNNYSTTSFALPAISLPLIFRHEYNSYLTNLPEELFPSRPLGYGWTHTYMSYISKYNVWNDELGITEIKYFVVWPSGQMEVYKNSGSGFPRPLNAETKGVYDDFSLRRSDLIAIKDKGQTTYRYELKSNGEGAEVFFLTRITDRVGNNIFVEYEVGNENRQRIKKVYRDLGNNKNPDRSLLFDYDLNTNNLNHVYIQNADIRQGAEIWFQVNSEGDLIEHTDRRHRQTFYKYIKDVESGQNDDYYKEREHLLWRVQLPKGNIINNQYIKRRLNSTKSSQNDLLTEIDVTPDWNSINPSFSSTIKQIGELELPNQVIHKTSINYEIDTGAPSFISSDDVDVDIYYDQKEEHPYIPTKVVDNGLEVTIGSIDDRGNIGNIIYRLTDQNPVITYTHQYQFNPYNDIDEYTDPSNNKTTFNYGPNPSQGLLHSIADQEGNSSSYEYFGLSDGLHKNGGLSQITSALGFQIPFEYDDYGNVSQVIAPGNRIATNTYDALGRIDTYKNPLNHVWDYDFYDNDYISKITNPRGDPIDYQYDLNDNLTDIINEKRKTTSLEYNFDTDLLESEEFGPNSSSYEYYNSGYLKSYTKPDNTTINVQYIASGYGVGQVQDNGYATFTYDEGNRVKTITRVYESKDYVLSYDYDALDRITSYTFSVEGSYNYSVGYEYDANGNISKINYPNLQGGAVLPVTYAYYKNNWLKTVTDWEGKVTEYFYRNDGSVDSYSLPNRTACHFEYDPVTNDLIRMYHERSDGSLLGDYNIVRDDLGRIDEVTKKEPMGYVGVGPSNIPAAFTDYNFAQSIGSEDISLDPNGNQTTLGSNTYTWDLHDMLESVNGTEKSYRYNGLSLRIESLDNGTQNRYIYDITGMSNLIAEWEEDGTIVYYIHGAGLLYRKVVNGSSYEDGTYHYNLQGSTVSISDESQNLSHKYQYEPWGGLIWSDEANANPFTFNGQYGVMMEDSNLYWMRARFYDAKQGRFLSEDGVWSTNLFSFAAGDPINKLDFSGYYTVDSWQYNAIDKLIPILQTTQTGIHIGLDAFGQIPGAGEIADGGNALIYAVEGDYENAALSSAALVPFAGNGATALKYSDDIIEITKKSDDIIEGIYEFTSESGKIYVGQSKNIPSRIKQHITSGKLGSNSPVVKIEIKGGKTAREVAEQQRINNLGGLEQLENIRNPIGPIRQHLINNK